MKSIFFLIFTLMSFELFARAGGGGGRGGGGGILTLIILGPYLIFQKLYLSYRFNRRRKKVSESLALMTTVEPEWNEAYLKKLSHSQFIKIQNYWSNQDLVSLEKELCHDLYLSWRSQINDQIAKNERNSLVGLSVNDLFIVDVQNFKDNDQDSFTVCIDAYADDQTTVDSKLMNSDKSKFREFWTYYTVDGKWKLFEITQAEGWKRFVNGAIVFENLYKTNKSSI